MYKHNQLCSIKVKKLRIILGSLLVSLPFIPSAASAAPSSVLNPCPRIYYEEPYNSTRIVPSGCPPNSVTRLLQEQTPAQLGNSHGRSSVAIPIQPPLPETRSNAIAKVMPMDGKVDVRLENNTNAKISYQAIGYTEPRILLGREAIVLRNLPTPVTVTVVRQDGGLLRVVPLSTSKQGVLEVSLDEAKSLGNNQGALRIQQDGQVFLN